MNAKNLAFQCIFGNVYALIIWALLSIALMYMATAVSIQCRQKTKEKDILASKVADLEMEQAARSHREVVDGWNDMVDSNQVPVLNQRYVIERLPFASVIMERRLPLLCSSWFSPAHDRSDEMIDRIFDDSDDRLVLLRWNDSVARSYDSAFDLETIRQMPNFRDRGHLLNMEDRKIVFRKSYNLADHCWYIECVSAR